MVFLSLFTLPETLKETLIVSNVNDLQCLFYEIQRKVLRFLPHREHILPLPIKVNHGCTCSLVRRTNTIENGSP